MKTLFLGESLTEKDLKGVTKIIINSSCGLPFENIVTQGRTLEEINSIIQGDIQDEYNSCGSQGLDLLFSKEVEIINLTPHTVNIYTEDLQESAIYPSQGIVRVSTKSKFIGILNGYTPLYQTEYGKVEGLPEEKEGVCYIVSMLVKQAMPHRKDLLSPSQPVRDFQGKVIGCLGLE